MKVLAMRFSAIGDVALLVPAFRQALESEPDLEITLVSRSFMEPFFSDLPRFRFIGIDLSNYKGIAGLLRLSNLLKQEVLFDVFLDLHDSIRTKIIRTFFRFAGLPVFVLDKGRAGKKQLTRKRNKKLRPLLHAVQRYLLVFKNAGLCPELPISPYVGDSGREQAKALDAEKLESGARFSRSAGDSYLFGFAPFAGFLLKELPEHKRKELLEKMLNSYPGSKVLLFGSRSQRSEMLGIKNALGMLSDRLFLAVDLASDLEQELTLISKLDLMISMDSANLHLSSLCGTKVIGIYGTTHPYLGFSPYGQEASGSFGLEGLDCRPCTVYGKGVCYRGDFACMNQLDLDLLIQRINERLSLS